MQIIGCYNSNNNTTKETTKDGNCFWWQGGRWHNIMLPPISHLKYWEEHRTDHQIINRLPIVNYESSFNPEAGNKHAVGYVQTLRSYRIPWDIRSQLAWLARREKVVLSVGNWSSKRCWIYREQDNRVDWFDAWEDAVAACMYRYHYHSYKWTWYAKRGVATKWYYKKWIEERM